MGTKGLFFPFLVAHGIIRHGSLIENGGKGKAPSAQIPPPRAFPSCARARKHGGLGTHGDVLSTILVAPQASLLKTLRTEYFLGGEIFIRGPLNSLVLVLSLGVYKSVVAIGEPHLATSSCSSSPFFATFLAGVGCVHTTERATPPPILMDFAAPHPPTFPQK